MLFLTFLVNVLMMVHKNQDLLRASIMSAGNSHRLGANEAPPAILSIFLGSQLSATLDEIVRQVTNSKRFPVNAKGEVRLRSVVSSRFSGIRPIPNFKVVFSSGVIFELVT